MVDARGCDLKLPELPEMADKRAFSQVDSSRPFTVFKGQKFDYIISISGVMEFDNTLQFFESCEKQLAGQGTLIVTNDNVITVRDRIEYMLFGKVRQYSIFVKAGEATWKILPIQNLCRILNDAGFRAIKISYASMKAKDYLWLPLVLPIYGIQWLYMLRNRGAMSIRQTMMLYPFRALLYRHYLIVCKKRGDGDDFLP